MGELLNLEVKNIARLYHELAIKLEKHKDKEPHSMRFVVEGDINNPLVAIDYPGRKMFKRTLNSNRRNVAQWANLFDFRVVPYDKGKALGVEDFTFDKFLTDFKDHKSNNEEFWNILEHLYRTNELIQDPPVLPGIDSKTFLLTLKWIWIEEDFNYRLKWDDVQSETKYVLAKISKSTGKEQSVSRGAGRAKFFAALVLLHRGDFTHQEVKKIIPLFN
ncbi:MAG: hypothetical protein HQ536_05080 [Parcubacteria group bacterium]|nr:hypothetical protein [Parcubacteria group bacterium]